MGFLFKNCGYFTKAGYRTLESYFKGCGFLRRAITSRGSVNSTRVISFERLVCTREAVILRREVPFRGVITKEG